MVEVKQNQKESQNADETCLETKMNCSFFALYALFNKQGSALGIIVIYYAPLSH